MFRMFISTSNFTNNTNYFVPLAAPTARPPRNAKKNVVFICFPFAN